MLCILMLSTGKGGWQGRYVGGEKSKLHSYPFLLKYIMSKSDRSAKLFYVAESSDIWFSVQ